MKRPGLLILAVAVLIIGGYAFYEYRQENADPKKKEAALIIGSMKEDQVLSFSIKTDKQLIEVSKDAETWKMLKPIEDLANQTAANDFIGGVLTEKFVETAREGESIDWTAYGLDKPMAVISLHSKDGSTESFQIGTGKNFEGNSFVRHNDENKVLVASSTWFAKANKSVGDFRDQRLMRLPNSKVNELIFERAGQPKFVLMRKENTWINLDQMKIRLDQNKVREILGMLNTTEALEFISEKPANAQESKLWELTKPSLKLTARSEDGKSWVALFSSGKDRIYRVAVSEPQFVLKLSPVDGEKFLLADFDSFRDRREAFQFDPDKIKSLDIKTEKITKLLKNESNEQAADIVKKIGNLNVTSFLPPSKNPLNNQVILLDQDSKSILQLKWGTPQKTKVAGTETSVLEASSNLVDYHFFITEQEINALKLQDVK